VSLEDESRVLVEIDSQEARNQREVDFISGEIYFNIRECAEAATL
jgi:hypothetical protein